MKWDALIESFQAVLGRVDESCMYCDEAKQHQKPEGCISQDMVVRDEIARLRGLQNTQQVAA